jgi:16S rRNA (uracil1498-N3)-methyltransferase
MSVRFYCPDPPSAGRLRLEADEARHLVRVCRFGVGDLVEVFDGQGNATMAEILRVGDRSVDLGPVGNPLAERQWPFGVMLATAVPKGDRFDWLVEKCTELGVERVYPIVTERSVVDPGGPKLARLRRAIIETSKQCGRNRLMVLHEPMTWELMAKLSTKALKLLADPAGLPPSRWPAVSPPDGVLWAVGPEGGFSSSENALAEATGWTAVSLSRNTLRIETAGVAGCAAVLPRVWERDEAGSIGNPTS